MFPMIGDMGMVISSRGDTNKGPLTIYPSDMITRGLSKMGISYFFLRYWILERWMVSTFM